MKNSQNLKDPKLKDLINSQLTAWNQKLAKPFIFEDVNDIYQPNPWNNSSEAIISMRNQRLRDMNKILLLASLISLLIAAAIYILILI